MFQQRTYLQSLFSLLTPWLLTPWLMLCFSTSVMAQAFEPPLKRPVTNAPKTVQVNDQVKKDNTMTIAIHAWAPWSGANLQSMGPLPHLVSEILAKDGMQPRYRFVHWGRALDTLSNNEVDAAIVWISADLRTDPFVVSDPILRERAALYFPANKSYNSSLDTITKARMAWNETFVYEYDVYNKLESHAFTPFPVKSEVEALRSVISKQTDFAVIPYSMGRMALAKLNPTEQKGLKYVMLENSFPAAYFLIQRRHTRRPKNHGTIQRCVTEN